jgi:hypothetical protein
MPCKGKTTVEEKTGIYGRLGRYALSLWKCVRWRKIFKRKIEGWSNKSNSLLK